MARNDSQENQAIVSNDVCMEPSLLWFTVDRWVGFSWFYQLLSLLVTGMDLWAIFDRWRCLIWEVGQCALMIQSCATKGKRFLDTYLRDIVRVSSSFTFGPLAEPPMIEIWELAVYLVYQRGTTRCLSSVPPLSQINTLPANSLELSLAHWFFSFLTHECQTLFPIPLQIHEAIGF